MRCDYIYRQYIDGVPSDRYPVGRNFDPGEFATLFAEPQDIVELVFKGEPDYAALSLSLYKLQTEAPDLDLETQRHRTARPAMGRKSKKRKSGHQRTTHRRATEYRLSNAPNWQKRNRSHSRLDLSRL